jgi:G3E family GTPase
MLHGSWQAVLSTLARDVEYIIVETSGMADPGPVANTFLVPELPRIREKTVLDGIITIVDAEHLHESLQHAATTHDQIAAADVVLLNKVDLVDAKSCDTIENELHKMNPRAYVFRTIKARAPVSVLLATGKFDIDRWVAEGRDRIEHHEHAPFVAVSITQDAPLSMDATSILIREIPASIFRAKGVLCISNLSDLRPEKDIRMVFQKVGKRISTTFDRPWQQGEKHESVLVLIGPAVDKQHWQQRLDSCVR